MKLTRRIIAAGALALAGAVAAVTAAVAAPTTAPRAAGAAEPGYAIEDFSYPDGARIGAELGIVLKRGDGRITLVDCASADSKVQVFSRTVGTVCFRATGPTGQLSVEIPTVYGLKGDATHKTDVTLTAEGAPEQNIAVAKNEWKSVGETVDPQRRDHVLVEIRTSQ
ncbi:hypothetical protein ACN20G_34895 (plasmid) [Streptomyces sp. BI20]|uniref:hypothetical protein n=1 Tax=Streptomyces sp. BI20 TaxID=3403460 RepID=UPI003C78B4DC